MQLSQFGESLAAEISLNEGEIDMHAEYLALVQMGLIIGLVNLLAPVPAFSKIGIPAISMVLTLLVCSTLPKFLPNAYHAVIPDIPTWPFIITAILVPTLGAYAGDEIELQNLRHMGRNGIFFIATSLIAPVVLAIPIGLALVLWKGNPFIQENANSVGVVLGIVAVVFMRALPTMIAFFKSNHWNNDMVKVSLTGASFDDLTVFVLFQPIIAGLVSGGGWNGIAQSTIAVVITGASFFIMSRIVRMLPLNFQLPLGILVLFGGAGLAEVSGHVHVILSGIFWGMMMPKNVTKEFEHKTKDFVITVLVPLFFAGLGITKQFDIIAWQPWILMIACLAAAFIAHEFVTAPMAAKLFGNNRVVGRILGALCRTHGTADVLLAVTLFDMGILTTFGLSGVVMYLMVATIQAFGQAQSLVDKHPELVNIKMQTLPLPEEDIFVGEMPLVYASMPDNEDI